MAITVGHWYEANLALMVMLGFVNVVTLMLLGIAIRQVMRDRSSLHESEANLGEPASHAHEGSG